MSEREMVIQLIDKVPDYKIGYALAYINGLIADEEADDLFCEKMIEGYENDPDPDKDRLYSLDEAKKEWGIS